MLLDEIMQVYPELDIKDFAPGTGLISLRDDGDGIVYIGKWNYEKSIPKGMKLGK
jgi:hypothetical protein